MKRKKYLEKKNNSQRRKYKFLYLILIIIFLLLFLLATLFIKFSNLEKYSFAVRNKLNNNTDIYIVDSSSSIVKKYSISGDIVVDSSFGYGEYKLSNLWALADNEKLGGQLVTKSIVKNFGIPVIYYIDGNKTNMNLIHKIKSKLVIRNKKDVDREILSSQLSKSITADFVDRLIQESGVEVVVYDYTGTTNTVEKVSEIINVLGSKIVDYQRSYDKDLNCVVEGKSDVRLTHVLVEVFDCEYTDNSIQENKVIFKIGEKFLSNF